MQSKRFRSSLVALGGVAAIAGVVAWFASRPALPPVAESGAAVHSGSEVASSPSTNASASAKPALSIKDPCEKTTDRCSCAADHGAQLLAASFPERALQVLSRAPSSCAAPEYLGARAEALAALERGDEASAMAVRALQADPKNRFARRARAIALIQSKDYDKADAALRALVAEDEKDADSLFYLALSQRKRDRYNGAREGFLRVLRINAQHVDARYQLVTLTAAAGAAQEAEHDYDQLLQIAPAGDPRVVAARAALNKSDKSGPSELPTLHRAGTLAPSASVVPPR